jgi:cytochrome c2
MNEARLRFRRHRTPAGLCVAALLVIVAVVGISTGDEPASDPGGRGDVLRGWRVFNEKQCIDCHAIWGHGGDVGPDLGRIRSGPFSGDRVAGIMWNHIPKMMARMKQSRRPPGTLSANEMADAFALVGFVRQLDELGDPTQGERILRVKGCTECHSIDTPGGTIGPDLAVWGSYANPIIWAQMMWEHAPVMEEAMRRLGMRWPKLEGNDLIHIVAYVRSAGVSKEKTYLSPGSVQSGKRLFSAKKCDQCHPGTGPDLSKAELPSSIGSLASRMWNHSPVMTRTMLEKDLQRLPVSPQELADILTYVLTLSRRERTGDVARGQRVFMQKGCKQCHEAAAGGEGTAPALAKLAGSAAPAEMAAAMWNHGETMLDRMTEAGIAWPMFNEDEMADMLAYLRSGAPAQP